MQAPNLFLIFTNRLNKMGVRYMVTGSAASILYGEPRLTHDVDLVIELSLGQLENLAMLFSEEEFYLPPMEALKIEINRKQRGHFNIIHHDSGFKADIYLMGQDSLHQWGLSKTTKLEVGGEPIWIAPPEYVIVRKLEYFREGGSQKHLEDIRAMLRVSSSRIDQSSVDKFVQSLGLIEEWRLVRQ